MSNYIQIKCDIRIYLFIYVLNLQIIVIEMKSKNNSIENCKIIFQSKIADCFFHINFLNTDLSFHGFLLIYLTYFQRASILESLLFGIIVFLCSIPD